MFYTVINHLLRPVWFSQQISKPSPKELRMQKRRERLMARRDSIECMRSKERGARNVFENLPIQTPSVPATAETCHSINRMNNRGLAGSEVGALLRFLERWLCQLTCSLEITSISGRQLFFLLLTNLIITNCIAFSWFSTLQIMFVSNVYL